MGVRQNIRDSVAQAIISGKNFSLKQKNGYNIYRDNLDTVNIENDNSLRDSFKNNSTPEINFKGKVFNRRIDGDQVVYDRERGVRDIDPSLLISGVATYDSSLRKITYTAVVGSNLNEWGFLALSDSGQILSQQNLPSSNPTYVSEVLTAMHEGTWNVTFQGFKDGTQQSSFLTSVVVESYNPYIKIVSIEKI